MHMIFERMMMMMIIKIIIIIIVDTENSTAFQIEIFFLHFPTR